MTYEYFLAFSETGTLIIKELAIPLGIQQDGVTDTCNLEREADGDVILLSGKCDGVSGVVIRRCIVLINEVEHPQAWCIAGWVSTVH